MLKRAIRCDQAAASAQPLHWPLAARRALWGSPSEARGPRSSRRCFIAGFTPTQPRQSSSWQQLARTTAAGPFQPVSQGASSKVRGRPGQHAQASSRPLGMADSGADRRAAARAQTAPAAPLVS